MIKSKLIQLITAAKETIFHLRDNLPPLNGLQALKQLEEEESLLHQIEAFQLTAHFSEKDDNQKIYFSDFIVFSNFSKLTLPFEQEGELARICHLWLKEEECGQENTFMGTQISEISLGNLVYLDNIYFDAAELLDFMMHQQTEGKNILQNPFSEGREKFSTEAQTILEDHPVTRAFISANISEEERLRIQHSKLPENFYDLLQSYLTELCEIGKETTPWSFPDASVAKCDEARNKFFNEVNQSINEELRAVLSQIKIYAPLKRGGTEDVAYRLVIEGQGAYSCVISQQIYLWSLLREKRPSIIVPSEVSSHWQASLYDLGGTTADEEQRIATTINLQPSTISATTLDISLLLATRLQMIAEAEERRRPDTLNEHRRLTDRSPSHFFSSSHSPTFATPIRSHHDRAENNSTTAVNLATLLIIARIENLDNPTNTERNSIFQTGLLGHRNTSSNEGADTVNNQRSPGNSFDFS